MNCSSTPFEIVACDPSRYFESPLDIARDRRLDVAKKLKLLSAWETDARVLETATNENMIGGEPSRLEEVKEALYLLTQACRTDITNSRVHNSSGEAVYESRLSSQYAKRWPFLPGAVSAIGCSDCWIDPRAVTGKHQGIRSTALNKASNY